MPELTPAGWPTFDPTSGQNLYRWIRAAAQQVRQHQPERIATQLQRIEQRAATHGDQPIQR